MTTEISRTIRIATRESQLALWQAHFVANSIRQLQLGFEVQLVPMTTIGDRDLVTALPQMGGQGVFTREVQKAVLSNHADIAVHSLKDLPTVPSTGLVLAGVPVRAPRFDALVLPNGEVGNLRSLPQGAKVGTSSPRRRSQLLLSRPDLDLHDIRGNVETRLSKVDSGEFAATILAEAGLRRLNLEHRISAILEPPYMFPAVGQAALGIECREDDQEIIELLAKLTDADTMTEVTAERACLRALKAGCHAPVGVYTRFFGDELNLDAIVINHSGTEFYAVTVVDHRDKAEDIGIQAAAELLEKGAGVVIEESR